MKPEKDKVASGNECESSWRKAHMVSIRRCRGQPAERPSQIRPLLSQPCHLWIWLSSSSSSVVAKQKEAEEVCLGDPLAHCQNKYWNAILENFIKNVINSSIYPEKDYYNVFNKDYHN
ncbi:hypothetical protein TNCT_481301 [Trichonephila clavata]|uniref:Uncharacterized protein n=1 Tax=Trichonephila clavata TaxID=2740835 RepID=A0A8X6GNL7_TRICU|nr:hypothetical protein TNCT_481301 [Trichonephila clavata]